MPGAGGGILGGVMQLAGAGQQAIGAHQAAKAQKRAARQAREAMLGFLSDLQERGAGATRSERHRALQGLARARRLANQEMRHAQQRAQGELINAMASPAYQAQAAFLADAFSGGISQAVAGEYAGRLRTAQAARGLSRGGAATRDEAALLTKLSDERRQQLLPQLRQLALDPMQLQQQTITNLLATRQQAQQIGLAEYQARTGGLQAAQSIANQQVIPIGQIGASIYQNLPFSAVSASGAANMAAGGGVSGAGSSIAALGIAQAGSK
jgi:hypothetical protein